MERVIEIMNYVMKQVLFQNENNLTERSLNDALRQLGYRAEEIETAFKLFYSIPQTLKSGTEEISNLCEIKEGYRIFSASEKRKLSLPFQGEIIRLINYDLITKVELEQILAEALQMETQEVGLKELEIILHKVVNDEERLLMIFPHPIEIGHCFMLN